MFEASRLHLGESSYPAILARHREETLANEICRFGTIL